MFAQPAGLKSKLVRQHYEETILRPVIFDDHADLLAPHVRQALHRLFPGGRAPLWGVTPGLGDANWPKIRRMRAGDVVFFSGSKKLYLVGTIALAWHNPQLAERLWQRDARTGQTWEYMYALTGVRGIDVPMDEVRTLLNWNRQRNIMGFSALKENEGELLRTLVDFDPETPHAGAEGAVPPPADAGTAPSAPSDGKTYTATARAEQARLKNYLLPGTEGECALCGRLLPRPFLVAAHIKKRQACSEAERWDVGNIAMLACLLGCDSLYEHGLITVSAHGHLQVSPLARTTPAVARHIDTHLDGRSITWWNPRREPYYAWHRTHTFQTGAPTPADVTA
ncbi:hypothetical protein [Streptomyces sp. ODS28]|uniref:hypothetical protein n=1 Tax=Streptomyces sp. ODS28 TaxID=3136688 RepID=UPI0031EC576F